MTYYQFGNLSVPALWIAAIGALFIASIVNRVFTGKKTSDWFWNGFFLYVLIWKLSYIVFNFEMFLEMPLSIVYFNGGMNGHILGLVILSLYLMMSAPKKFPSIYEESSRLFLVYFICYEVLLNLIEKNQIETFGHLVILGGFIFYLLSIKKNQNRLSSKMFILFMLLELLIISYFQTVLSMKVLTFVWIGLIMFRFSSKINKEDRAFE